MRDAGEHVPVHTAIGQRPWKGHRALVVSQHANGTIDPWYGCDTFDKMIDYALNFSAPWGTLCRVDCALAGLMVWGGSGARS